MNGMINEVSDLYLCKCDAQYKSHHPGCRARSQYECASTRANKAERDLIDLKVRLEELAIKWRK